MTTHRINGLDTGALGEIARTLVDHPEQAQACFRTRTEWTGGMSAKSTVAGWRLGGEEKPRMFEFVADEPPELLGDGAGPNPQELLLGAVASCMSVTYAVTAATMGIRLDALTVDMSGSLDLRGAMGLSDEIGRGFPEVACTVTVSADAGEDAIRALHERVLALSANVEHLTRAVPLAAELVIRG